MYRTALQFIEERGLINEYRAWQAPIPKDRSEYMKEWYQKKKKRLLEEQLLKKRNQ